jgi:hypothetical protein
MVCAASECPIAVDMCLINCITCPWQACSRLPASVPNAEPRFDSLVMPVFCAYLRGMAIMRCSGEMDGSGCCVEVQT